LGWLFFPAFFLLLLFLAVLINLEDIESLAVLEEECWRCLAMLGKCFVALLHEGVEQLGLIRFFWLASGYFNTFEGEFFL